MAKRRTRAEQRRRARSGENRSSGSSPLIPLLIVVGTTIAIFAGLRAFGDDSPSIQPGTTLITATEFAYSPALVDVSSDATLMLRNEGAVYHDLRIDGIDDFSLEALPNEEATGSIHLKPGSYVLFCSVPGHREAGMVAELQVS